MKLFLFHTQARQVSLEDLPDMDRVERTGVGVRYERRLRRSLFAQASYLHNRTTNDTPLAPFDGGTAPYHAPHLAGLSLNYVDETGTKAGLQLNYVGRFYQDTGALSALDRPIFPSRAYVDLLLAQEPSLDHEIFLKVFNVFNSDAIQFNDWPTGERRLVLGVTKRF